MKERPGEDGEVDPLLGPGKAPPGPADTGERLVPGAHPDHVTEAEHLARYQLAASLAEGHRVLDVGCGLGYGSAMMARAGAQGVLGIDVDEPTIAWASDQFGELAEFEVGDALILPWSAPTFDMVVSFELIEHLPDPLRALDEMKRVMTEGGLLVVSSPNRGRYREDNPFHLHELTTEELELALQARFANVAILRQQMHMASVICSAEAMELEDPEVEIATGVRKLVPNRPGEELFALGIASDGELPPVENITMLTGGIAMRHWFDAAAAWENRARHAEADAEATRLEIAHAEHRSRVATEELAELRMRLGNRRPWRR